MIIPENGRRPGRHRQTQTNTSRKKASMQNSRRRGSLAGEYRPPLVRPGKSRFNFGHSKIQNADWPPPGVRRAGALEFRICVRQKGPCCTASSAFSPTWAAMSLVVRPAWSARSSDRMTPPEFGPQILIVPVQFDPSCRRRFCSLPRAEFL